MTPDRKPRLRRSCLAVPGSSEKMLRKAASLPADEVFIDLEDAVAPDQKTERTRRRVVAALRDQEWRAQTLTLRVNPVGSRWCLDDILEVVPAAGDALDCIIVPKVERASDLHFVAELLTQVEIRGGIARPLGIEAQIESPRGLVEIERIAAATPRLEALIFGPGDYAAAAGMPQLTVGALEPPGEAHIFHYALARLATAACAFGLQAIDGPYADIRDLDGLATSARRSHALGFEGKWALHPDQVPVCNGVYAPTATELDHAERIIDAYEQARMRDGSGAALFESEMIDEASRRMAEATVERARAAGLVVEGAKRR
jgi:citrate lyase subunit beta / citryl-CoA lyase